MPSTIPKWGKNDLLCVLSGKGKSLNRFQWFYLGNTLCNKLPRTTDGDEAWEWLKKEALGMGMLLGTYVKRTVTQEFYLANKDK